VRKADNLPPSCAVVTKYGNLNFLEPSGPVQACKGTALPLLCFMSVEGTGKRQLNPGHESIGEFPVLSSCSVLRTP
jgi:hypothetical protein